MREKPSKKAGAATDSKSRGVSCKRRILRLSLIALVTIVTVLGGFAGSVYYYVKLPTIGSLPVPLTEHADPNRLRGHVLYLSQEVVPRDARHPENLNKAAAHIHSLFALTSKRVRDQVYAVEGVDYRNVIAQFGPESGSMVVVGAHYDAFREHPGADDNASGVAVLLEVARLLGQGTVKRPVELVAYSTEEPPFYGKATMGSAVHARDLRERGVELAGMFCLEMVGYYADTQDYPDEVLKWLYPEKGQFIGIIGRWEDRHLVRFLKKGFRGSTDLPVQSCTMPMENSDHRCYWQQGYAAVMITDTAMARNKNYHTPNDTADTLNYEKMAGVADGVLCALLNLDAL